MYILSIFLISCFTFGLGYLLSSKRAKNKLKNLEEIRFEYEKLLIEKENKAKSELVVKFLTGELYLDNFSNIEKVTKNSSNLK